MNEHKRLAEEMRGRARAWRIGWVGDNGLGDLLAGFAESWADRIEALGGEQAGALCDSSEDERLGSSDTPGTEPTIPCRHCGHEKLFHWWDGSDPGEIDAGCLVLLGWRDESEVIERRCSCPGYEPEEVDDDQG